MRNAQVMASTGADPTGDLVRPDGDFFATSPATTRALLAVEASPGVIWEPAAGDGAMARVLAEPAVVTRVMSSDLVDVPLRLPHVPRRRRRRPRRHEPAVRRDRGLRPEGDRAGPRQGGDLRAAGVPRGAAPRPRPVVRAPAGARLGVLEAAEARAERRPVAGWADRVLLDRVGTWVQRTTDAGMVNVILIIEGADGSGKSVLARHLVEMYNGRYMHSRVWRDCARWHRGIVRRALRISSAGGLAICDRMWPSELIYGPIFRGHAYADDVATELDDAIRAVPHAYVLCVPLDVERHLARFEASRATGRETFDRVEAVAQRYADLLLGNVAHPGDNLVDRFIRFGDFAVGRRVVHYDLDRDGPRMAAFAAGLVRDVRRGA